MNIIEWAEKLQLIPEFSPAWVVTLKAFYDIPMSKSELKMFKEISGRVNPPKNMRELLVVAGRRGAKSLNIARLGVFEATQGGHGVALAPGQYGLIPIISPLKEQSREIMNYARGLCQHPVIRGKLDGEPTATEIRFKSRVIIRIMAADALNVSGPTLVSAILDEKAKLAGSESKMPDVEIINSLRPALAPIIGAPPRRLIGITSAYLKEGVAYEQDKEWFGKEDAPLLVIKGPTTLFNPNIDTEWLEQERKAVGEKMFAREYLAIWQDAVTEHFFEDIEKCIDKGRPGTVINSVSGLDYWVAIDPAFRQDQFALAVCHRERREEFGPLHTVIDYVETWQAPKGQTLSADVVLAEVAKIARQYGTEVVFTDQASAPVLIEVAKRTNLHLVEVPWTGGYGHDSKTSKYRRVHNAMADARIHLPDHEETIKQFYGISSTELRQGGERIENKHGHDDLVSACVMAITIAMTKMPDYSSFNMDAKTEYELKCEKARAQMDEYEIAAMNSAVSENEERAWKNAGLGFGASNIFNSRRY